MGYLKNNQLESDVFNKLRSAAKYGRADEVDQIRNEVTKEEYYRLMRTRNNHYSYYRIIDYAIQFNRFVAVKALLKGLTLEGKLEICNEPVTEAGCNVLHLSVNNNCYEAAAAIRDLFYEENQLSGWVRLFTDCEHSSKETPAHYAARRQDLKFFEIFSKGLSSEQWYSILLKQNLDNRTFLEVYLINCRKFDFNPFEVLRGPINLLDWLEILIQKKGRDNRSNYEYIINKFMISYFDVIEMSTEKHLLVNWESPCPKTNHGPYP
ncbi:MAG: hypothetical protein U1E78_10085 [Gammaproteobacteria bacterium]